jgi:hypothetical protein
MFGAFALITGILLWFGSLIVVRCERVAERRVEERLETRDGVTARVPQVTQEGRVDVTVQQRILAVLPVRTERLADVVQADVEQRRPSPSPSRGGRSGRPDPQLRLVLRDGTVWTSQPVRYAVGTPPWEMAKPIQEFIERSSAPSLRLWWLQWVLFGLSIPCLAGSLLILAAGVNMARRQLGGGAA